MKILTEKDKEKVQGEKLKGEIFQKPAAVTLNEEQADKLAQKKEQPQPKEQLQKKEPTEEDQREDDELCQEMKTPQEKEREAAISQEVQKLMDYLKPKLPDELAKLLDEGKSPQEAYNIWENIRLKKENEKLRLQLEKANQPVGEMAGEGTASAPNPFVEGFMQALSER